MLAAVVCSSRNVVRLLRVEPRRERARARDRDLLMESPCVGASPELGSKPGGGYEALTPE